MVVERGRTLYEEMNYNGSNLKFTAGALDGFDLLGIVARLYIETPKMVHFFIRH